MQLATVGLAGALLAACSSGSRPVATAGSPPAAATTRPPSSPPPVRPKGPALSAGLNGTPSGRGRPVVVVKVDNTAPAHPQTGLSSADLIYVEPVEGGLTRLIAVFSSTQPSVVGPVRSARESDVELLAEYGRVLLGFAGANSGVRAIVNASPLINGSFDVVTGAYFRDWARPAPYNLFLRPAALLAARPTVRAGDVGLRFGSRTPPPGGRVNRGFSARYGPAAMVSVTYDPVHHTWPVAMDGAPDTLTGGTRLAPANVIVQYVVIRGSRFSDVLGNPTPYPVTVGTGPAVVFRDGRAYAGRWSRPSAAAGTHFLDGRGQDLALRPGQTWILLVPRGTPLGRP